VSFYRLDRFEMKFVIVPEQRNALMGHLGPHLRADANADETANYPIVSLYYDNDDRDCYWEKIRGSQNRRKLRVRVYGSLDGKVPPTCFIEVKHKQDGRGVKRRIQMPLEDALLVGEGKEPTDNVKERLSPTSLQTIREVHDLVKKRGFKPVMVMRYDRQAFAAADPTSDLRITYDTGIFYRTDNLDPIPDDRRFSPSSMMLKPGTSVLEVKINGTIPYWLSRVIAQTGCRLQSHSKYCNALEHGDPVLQSMLAPSWRKAHPPCRHNEIDTAAASCASVTQSNLSPIAV